MEKLQFDKSQTLDYFIKSLRNKSLLPKPHLGVLETKFPESNPAWLFTFSDCPVSQNIVGYDFLIKENGENPLVKTNFNFFVRAGEIKSSEESEEEDFIPINCVIELNLKTLTASIVIKNGRTGEEYKKESLIKYREIGSKYFFKSNWNHNFNIKYKIFEKDEFKEKANNLNISFFKNVKDEGNGRDRFQLRIVNENEKGSEITTLNKVGVIKRERETYQNIPLGLLLDFEINEECIVPRN